MGMLRCLAVAALVFCAAAPPAGAAGKPYLLSQDEIGGLRHLSGVTMYSLFYGRSPFADAANRAFKSIARPIKVPGTKMSWFRIFDRQTTAPDEPSVLERERFFVAFGCQHRSCPSKGSFVVDLKTGHVVMAVTSRNSPQGLPMGTLLMKSCVDPDLRAFAEIYYSDRWGVNIESVTSRC